MHYGNRLKWLIKNKGFSQREIAAALNIPESTLSGWTLKESPDIADIESICKILEIPLSRFFADADNLIELTSRERELLRLFNEFTDDKKAEVIRFVELLQKF